MRIKRVKVNIPEDEDGYRTLRQELKLEDGGQWWAGRTKALLHGGVRHTFHDVWGKRWEYKSEMVINGKI